MQEGSSIVELVVALSILSVLIGIAWGSAGNAIRRVPETLHESVSAAKAASVDEALRAAIGRIRPPYWEANVPVETSRTTDDVRTTAHYVDGQPDRQLQIVGNGDSLRVMIDGTTVQQFDEVVVVASTVETDETDSAIGVRFEYVIGNDRMTTIAALGSVGLWVE